MAKVVKTPEQTPKNTIERGTIVKLKDNTEIGIVYKREQAIGQEYSNTIEYIYHVLWFDAKNSYSVYDKYQLEFVEGKVTIKN